MTTEAIQQESVEQWRQANHHYLDAEFRRLRLLLHRRVLWLRRQWQHDPLQQYTGMVISDAQADWLLAADDRGAEERFYAEDQEAAAISGSIAAARQESVRQADELRACGTPPAIEVLAKIFGLGSCEREVLLLCLAPELDATFASLCAYVQDDVSHKYPTLHLASGLLGDAEAVVWGDALSPEAPLRRFRLVTVEATGSTCPLGARPLRLDERIVDYLLGRNRLDERLSELLRPVPKAPLTPAHEQVVHGLLRWMQAREDNVPWPAINLVGPPGAGKTAVARALCDQCGARLYALDPGRLPPTSNERFDVLRLVERESALLQFALLVNASALDANDKPAVAVFNDVVDHSSVLLFVGSAQPWRSERASIAVRVPKPDSAGQYALWQQALAGVRHSVNGQLDVITQQFTFGPTAVVQAVYRARSKVALGAESSGEEVSAGALWAACREQAAAQLDELAQRLTPSHTWDDIVLPDDRFNQLRELCAQVAQRTRVYDAWGFGAKLSRGRGISALFAGPSGTGKTLAAEVIAGHLGLDLYRIDLAGVVSKYIGETEKNLRRVFDCVEQSGAILFFDEADALFGKRSEVKDSHDRYANIEIDYLLQRMEDYRGLAILATNMKSHLDQAFLRRLRFVVDFPLPDAAHRRRIWQAIFPASAPLDGVDYDALARLDVSGGNIKNIALNAAFLAAETSPAIRMEHVLRAAKREYVKIDKLVLESEFGRYYGVVQR